ncbi:MAG: tripartite tricarboxylate transporter substrate binding protein [Gammaproteobacteria bacterium]|nr:tripartite tricarboxylate transporter substrate binding protein [Gammaproteobacteria bacterium]
MLVLLALGLAAPAVQAQDRYPSKPVRIVIPFAAGGIGDRVGRLLAQQLADIFGQQVLVENPAGGDAIPGTVAASRASPDGYTVLQVTSTQIVNMVFRDKVPYDLLRDFAPVARSSTTPLLLAVPATSPYRTVPDLVAQAKARAGAMPYGSGGVGSISHLSAELFKRAAGVASVHVPYKGYSAMLPDLISGRLDFSFMGQADVVPHLAGGRLRALAITSPQRVSALPDLPTMREIGFKDFESAFSYTYVVPRGTPEPVVRQLQDAIVKALANATLQERMVGMGLILVPGGPEQVVETIRAELKQWGQVIRDANIRPE